MGWLAAFEDSPQDLDWDGRVLYVAWWVSLLKSTLHALEKNFQTGWWAGWLLLNTALMIYCLWDVRVLYSWYGWLVG